MQLIYCLKSTLVQNTLAWLKYSGGTDEKLLRGKAQCRGWESSTVNWISSRCRRNSCISPWGTCVSFYTVCCGRIVKKRGNSSHRFSVHISLNFSTDLYHQVNLTSEGQNLSYVDDLLPSSLFIKARHSFLQIKQPYLGRCLFMWYAALACLLLWIDPNSLFEDAQTFWMKPRPMLWLLLTPRHHLVCLNVFSSHLSLRWNFSTNSPMIVHLLDLITSLKPSMWVT